MKKNRLLFLWLFAALITISSCKKSEEVSPDEDISTVVKLDENEIDATLMLKLVNELRSKGCQCGSDFMPAVHEVTWNTKLELAALGHNKDMAENDFFSHTGSDDSKAGDRIFRQGYSWSTYAENIAKGYSNEKAVMDGWINSEGHCKNLMNKNCTEIGVAKYTSYWTQVFAKPKN